mmetsp:Transcript_78825/g.139285  ORF Transcript_78825/g.139285 Transcript_78825/m.139285 type:complete len:93 (+) Transcript_78825:173-451(+)
MGWGAHSVEAQMLTRFASKAKYNGRFCPSKAGQNGTLEVTWLVLSSMKGSIGFDHATDKSVDTWNGVCPECKTKRSVALQALSSSSKQVDKV